MNAKQQAKRYAYARGAVADELLRRGLAAHLVETALQDPSPADKLLTSYFDYHVSRLINLYVVSGSVDLESLSGMLTTITQVAFQVLLSKDKAERRASGEIQGKTVLYRHGATASELPAARLGVPGSCEAGNNMILGALSAEEVACVELTITTSVEQFMLLRANPKVLVRILDALESAIPLNLDFRLKFSVREEDRSFRLSSSKTSKTTTATAPLLGITSALNAGASE